MAWRVVETRDKSKERDETKEQEENVAGIGFSTEYLLLFSLSLCTNGVKEEQHEDDKEILLSRRWAWGVAS